MKTVTYHEVFPHFMGTLTATFDMTWEEFCSISEVDVNDDDVWSKLEQCADERAGQTVYGFYELLHKHKFSKLKNALTKNGTWSGEWEEGTFSLTVQ